MTEVFAALVGAVLAGLFQTVDRICARRREAEAVLTAIASEVASICHLVRHQRYLELAQEISQHIDGGTWDGSTMVVDVKQNYFVVFEGLVEKIGMLRPSDVAKIVLFYSHCKSVMDSTHAEGIHTKSSQREFVAANLKSATSLLRQILELGDEITQMPQQMVVATLSTQRLPYDR